MVARSRYLAILGSVLLSVLATACGSPNSAQVTAVTIGQPDDPFEKGLHLSLGGQLTRASVAEGLVAFDELGRVVPALADRWIVTDDGKSYIFRLRDGNWLDGSELTARSATLALKNAVKVLGSTPLGIDLAGIDEIREMAGRVVEIRLTYPMPHLLQLLAQPELGLSRDGGGAGPMRMTRDGDVAILTPVPPDELGLPVIEDWPDRARFVEFSSIGGEEAVRRFNAGDVDLVLGGRLVDFPRTKSVGILRGTIQLDPVEGLFGLRFENSKGFLGDPANREALSMAVNRSALIAPFGLDGWNFTTRIVPGNIDGDITSDSERWQDMTFPERQSVAAARVTRWRGSQGEASPGPVLSIWLPEGPGSDILLERLRGDFSAIGVTVTRAGMDERADLRLIDTVARYPRATWYFNRFNCKAGKGLCSSEADAKLAEARRIEDAVARAALIGEAGKLLTDANVFIPFGSPVRWSLVRGDAIGFSTNTWGWHPLMPMALLPR